VPSCFDLFYNFFGLTRHSDAEVARLPSRDSFELFAPPDRYRLLSDFFVFTKEISRDLAELMFVHGYLDLTPSQFLRSVNKILAELIMHVNHGPVVFRLKELFPEADVIDLSEKLQYAPVMTNKKDCITSIERVDLSELEKVIWGHYAQLDEPKFVIEIKQSYKMIYDFIYECFEVTGRRWPQITLEPCLRNVNMIEDSFRFFRKHYIGEEGFSEKTISSFNSMLSRVRLQLADYEKLCLHKSLLERRLSMSCR